MALAKSKPILTRQDMIAFYIRQALEHASWGKRKPGKDNSHKKMGN